VYFKTYKEADQYRRILVGPTGFNGAQAWRASSQWPRNDGEPESSEPQISRCVVTTIDKIWTYIDSGKPFTLHLSDGRAITIYGPGEEEEHWIPLAAITSVSPQRESRKEQLMKTGEQFFTLRSEDYNEQHVRFTLFDPAESIVAR
jgi:hypothetical protein